MKYAHILAAVTEERWALHEPKLQAILDFLARQAGGEKLSADEIEARITKDREREVTRQSGSVAILPVRGVIANRMNMMDDISGGTSAEGLSRQFQAMMSDDGVKAVILDVDSPGGAVSGTVEFASMVAAARGRKPIVAHVNATAASAAYWIASAAEELVVTPSGMVGSIGVFGVHDDMSAALDKLGVKKTLVSAGKFKTAGNPYQPLDDDTRSRMQARVDEAYDMFVKAVASNRNVTQTAVREGFGQGDMVTAQAALAEGMVDRIATLEETLQRFGASQYAPPPRRRATAFARERAALAL